MTTLECGSFSIWFGTDDAPAPLGTIPYIGGEVVVRIGVMPDDPQLTIRIQYRRLGGTWMTLPTHALPQQGDETPRYYEGVFRDLAPGTAIEYTVQCQQAGRIIKASETKTLRFELKSLASKASRGKGSQGRTAPATPTTPKKLNHTDRSK